MISALLLAAQLAAAAPPPPAPAPAAGPTLTRPDWERVPDGDELADHYPVKASAEAVAGKAVIICRVSRVGKLNNCSIESEEPAGYGFGIAAVELSGLFRMKPAMVDGKPVSDAWIRIPLAFSPPVPDPVGDLDDAIQCYGIYSAWAARYPGNVVMAENLETGRGAIKVMAEKLKVAPAELEKRLAASKASPSTDPDVIEMCKAPG